MSDTTTAVQRGTFVPRTPTRIEAVRYDGSEASVLAILALFKHDGCDARRDPAYDRRLDIRFPDETYLLPVETWVWRQERGYDAAPMMTMDDDEFAKAFAPAPEPA